MSDEPRKRSRFDQTEPETATRKSRFDRRSRSPSSRDARDARSRSPIRAADSPDTEDKKDPAAAAAAAAARINASLHAKKGIQHVDVPPIRSTQSPGVDADTSQKSADGQLNAEIYQQDGDFIKDIEVNDLRNRYTLTKGSTQKMIKEETGADVTTRGNYYPDKSMATPANPPLYLHVTSTTKEGLEKAVTRINELMQQELPNLIDERRFRRRDPPAEQPERDSFGRRKWPEERIPIDLEPIPGFNLRAQVVGTGGSYVKHIQQETRCRVQIKGRGSGFMERDTNRESDEQMYLHVTGPEQYMVDQAKEQCLSLLETVRDNYEQFKERPPQPRGGGGRDGGYGGRGYGDDREGGHGGYHNRGDRQGNGSYGGGNNYNGGGYSGGYNSTPGYNASPSYAGAGDAQSAQIAVAAQPAAGNTTVDAQQYAAWSAYYAQNPEADPYAAYGGYQAVMAQYQQQVAGSYQGYPGVAPGQTQSPLGANGATGGAPPPPPPPPDDATGAPPPPPPGAPGTGGSGNYHAVPPPPGI